MGRGGRRTPPGTWRETGAAGDVVVVGDRWGALATALAGLAPTQISDSYLGQQATRANLARNVPAAVAERVRLLSTRDDPPARVDVLVVRVPKSLALLEDQLHRLAPAVHPDTVVVGHRHGRARSTPRRCGSSSASSARRARRSAVRKARLIFCDPGPGAGHGPRTRGRCATRSRTASARCRAAR